MSSDTSERTPTSSARPRLSVASTVVDPATPAGKVIAGLVAAVDAALALDPVTLSDVELLTVLDAVEKSRRRLPAARDPLISEIDVRGVPARAGSRSLTAYLRRHWQLGAGEASTWTSDADLFTPGRSITSGEVLPAKVPILAAARAAGRVSVAQTRVITDLLHRLPAALGRDVRAKVEASMVAYAREADPHRLYQHGQNLLDYVDPDGHYKDPEEIKRRRGLSLGREKDGLTPLSGQLDAWTAAALRAVLEPLARPGRDNSADKPEATDESVADAPDGCARTGDGTDTRTTPQRMHDALREAMEMLLGSEALPSQSGLPATILILSKLSDLERRLGIASTAQGGRIPVRDLVRHATKAKLIDVVTDEQGNPLFCGRTRRLASYKQRLALVARDRGCVIPGCNVPATRTEVHHMTPWELGGSTDIDTMALLCGHDHDYIEGWQLLLKSGRIWCIPPPWIDPAQVPRLNTYFHDPPLFDDLE